MNNKAWGTVSGLKIPQRSDLEGRRECARLCSQLCRVAQHAQLAQHHGHAIIRKHCEAADVAKCAQAPALRTQKLSSIAWKSLDISISRKNEVKAI